MIYRKDKTRNNSDLIEHLVQSGVVLKENTFDRFYCPVKERMKKEQKTERTRGRTKERKHRRE